MLFQGEQRLTKIHDTTACLLGGLFVRIASFFRGRMAANMFKHDNPAWPKRVAIGDPFHSRKSSRAPPVRRRDSWFLTHGICQGAWSKSRAADGTCSP